MKLVVVLCDGMADTPSDMLGGKTPMELANKPAMDWLARHGETGLVRTVPNGMPPGSDVANLTVMGYDTAECYTGRSPLEAANIGISLNDDDVAFRCNLVTLSDHGNFSDKIMLDYCAGDIHTEQADMIIRDIQRPLAEENSIFIPGPHTATVWYGTAEKPLWEQSPHPTTSRVG